MDIFLTTKNNDNKIIPINIPWVEKYRPIKSEDILLDKFIKKKIDKILETQTIPNMIITGEPGTGKTSTILCIAKEIYTHNYNDSVLELNASDDRGLSIINNTILPFCKKKMINNTIKLIILDEADTITTKAQNLLSNIIARYINTSRFVFICNDCSHITESIQSRCMIIKYSKINKSYLFNKIKDICINENIQYTDNGINKLLFLSDYDIRQCINNLECIYYSKIKFNEHTIYTVLDKPKELYMDKILKFCIIGDLDNALQIVINLYNKGYSPNDILLTFMKYLMETNIKPDEQILKIYEIISFKYVHINSGLDTLLQLCGCISNIYIYITK